MKSHPYYQACNLLSAIMPLEDGWVCIYFYCTFCKTVLKSIGSNREVPVHTGAFLITYLIHMEADNGSYYLIVTNFPHIFI